jgi:4,5:9,10-diseco-3-hydroxy-5,9,17-trioxoandrosta-1(10),2-diene-4-oate hydrolase
MKRHDITIGESNIRYYEAGDGPPVLLLHGAGATARLWKPQIDGMSSTFRVIAPDLPGFGGSDMVDYVNAVGDYSKFVHDFMGALDITSAHIVGSSMGGWIAGWFAADFPERVKRLILISPAGLHFDEMPPMSLNDIIAGIRAAVESLGEEAGREFEPNARTLIDLQESGGFEPDLIFGLSGIKSQTLILWGEHDPVIPPEYAGAFMEGIEGSVVKLVKGTGHVPHTEAPGSVNAVIAQFLMGP